MKKEKNPDFTDKDALEAANALKRLDLELNYDAVFFEGNGDLPPEILGAWLDNIKLFEDQSKNAVMITVHDFIGAPAFRRLEDIPSGELPQEIERVLEDLAEHAISIDRPDYISDADYYTFLTGKLPVLLHFFIAYEGKIESGEKLKFSGQGNNLLRMKYGFWCLEDIDFPGFRAAS